MSIQGLLNTALSAFAVIPGFDIVGVFDQNFNQLFNQARPLKLRVKEQAKVMQHPVETGIVITDHEIFEPIEIELSLLLTGGGITSLIQGGDFFNNYRSLYSEIRNLYEKGVLLTVQTKTATYQNMIIQAMPHEETSDVYDGIVLAVRFSEVQYVTAQYATLPPSDVQDPSNASTQQSGQKQPSDATAAQNGQASTLLKGFRTIGNHL